MVTSFVEDTTEAQLVRYWLSIELQMAREIFRVNNSQNLNELLSSHIKYQAAITHQESYKLVNHSLIP